MFASLKKLAFAVALTLCAATGMTLATGVATPAPAEAGILSSVKKVAVGAAKGVAGGVSTVAKGTAGGAKLAAQKIAVPFGKGIYQSGKTVVNAATPIAKKVGAQVVKTFTPVVKAAKKVILHRG